MKVFVFSLFLMFAFSLQGYSSNQTADKAEKQGKRKTSAVVYQEQERDCWNEASDYGDEIEQQTGNPYEGFAAFYSYYLSCAEECGCIEILDPIVI